MCQLTVAPLAEGWRLSADNVQNDMVFISGRAAEAAARRLALRLSRAGTPTELRIQLRDGSLGARFVYPPAWSASRTAEICSAAQEMSALAQAA